MRGCTITSWAERLVSRSREWRPFQEACADVSLEEVDAVHGAVRVRPSLWRVRSMIRSARPHARSLMSLNEHGGLLAWLRVPPASTRATSHRCRQYMRENWISNRIFASYGDILDPCCEAWNKLTDRPW